MDAIFTTNMLNIFSWTFCVRYDNVPLGLIGWCCAVVVGDDLIVLLLLMLDFFLEIAYVGCLHLVRTSLRCRCSVLSSFALEKTALALCISVLTTL